MAFEIRSVTGSTDTKLDQINGKCDQILANLGNANGVTFTQLNLAPTYQNNTSSSWNAVPSSTSNITDSDTNTSTNLFGINGAPFVWGELIISPGITIPSATRINVRVGLQALANNLNVLFELAAYDTSLAAYRNLWSVMGNFSNTTDTIIDIVAGAFFTWDKLRFRQWDIGQTAPRSRIYDLKVFSVS